jgi:uncharacterized protein
MIQERGVYAVACISMMCVRENPIVPLDAGEFFHYLDRSGLNIIIRIQGGHMDRVVHFEIPYDDKGRAMKFYSETFGWNLVDIPGADYTMAYAAKTDENHMVEEKGAINGGLFHRSDSAKGPMLVIGVESIDETIKKVVATGGRVITPKQPIPNGSYARVSDCEGNVIGLADESKD